VAEAKFAAAARTQQVAGCQDAGRGGVISWVHMATLDNVAPVSLLFIDFVRFGAQFLPPAVHDLPYAIASASAVLVMMGACVFFRHRKHTVIRVSRVPAAAAQRESDEAVALVLR
jgi:hypothetical protein